MSCVWHIGDLHLGHRAITKYRDVSSVEENDALMVDNILSVVKKRDTLWLHGDIFFTKASVAHYAHTLSDAVQNIHLIIGNHDLERVSKEEKNNCLSYLISLGYNLHGLTKDKKAWLSHAPIHEAELRGKISIHGHVHNKTVPDNRYVNVSVDNTGFYPVKRQDIMGGWRGC